MKQTSFCFRRHLFFSMLWIAGTGLGLCGQRAQAAASLQSLVDAAAPGSTLSLPAGTYYGRTEIRKSLVLQGAGAGVTILDGKLTNSVLVIHPGTWVTLNDLMVTQGNDQGFNNPMDYYGGGGIKNFGHLTLNRCRIEENYSASGPDASGHGGGIMSQSRSGPASLLMNGCTVRRNRVGEGAGGGIYNGEGVAATLNHCTVSSNYCIYDDGAGIFGGEPLIVNNSTISGNSTLFGYGGGIRANGMILNHCTITANLSDFGSTSAGAGIYGSVAECQNTIIAGNLLKWQEGRLLPSDCNGVTIISKGYNLIGDGTDCRITPAVGDKIGTASNPIDPKLGPLQSNGGPTETHALLSGSPAIDQASQGGFPIDQRGALRPYNYSAIPNAADGSDMGAFESTATAPLLNQAPAISRIPDQSIRHGASAGPIPFTISDAETSAERLTVSGRFVVADGNTSLPVLDIVLGGTGVTRTVTLASRSSWVGTVRIIVTVRDEKGATADSVFLLNLVSPYLAKAAAPATLAIFDEAGPFSSKINLSGLAGVVKTINVTLRDLNHANPSDLWFLLINPSGRAVWLMSKAGAGYDLNHVNLRFDDTGAALPQSAPIVSGTYRPTAYDKTYPIYYPPRYTGPLHTKLSELNGSNPNGTWALYAFDPVEGVEGILAGGWSLEVATQDNTPPTINSIPDQAANRNTATDLLIVTVGDQQTPAQWLTVSVSGDNETLTPFYSFDLGGSGSERTLIIHPAQGATGSSRIRLRVSDELSTVETSFNLTVTDTGIRSQSFFSGRHIQVPSSGPASPYPESIQVSGMSIPIKEVKVTLNRISHTWPADLNVLLVGPGGQKALLMARTGYRYPLQDVTLQFQNSAASPLPQSSQIRSGIYRPTSFSPVRSFPAPAPALPYTTNLSVFNGTLPNGSWNLYVWDDSSGDEGYLRSGWGLTLVAESSPAVVSKSFTNSAAISILDNKAAAPYPSLINVSGLSGTISKATVTIRGLSHTWPGDILMLLVGPTGQKSYVMAKAGRNNRLENVTLQFDDAATASLLATGPIVSGTYKPTSYATRSLLAPAPPAPYVTNFSVFKGKAPNGAWALYVMDDSGYDAGRIANGWSLNLTLATAGVLSVESLGGGDSSLSNQARTSEVSSFWLDPVKVQADRTIQLRLHGQPGQRYAIQASANGADWRTVRVVVAPGDTVEVDDHETGDAVRLYRAVITEP